MKKKVLIIASLLLLLLLPLNVAAQQETFTHVISNSENWKDVYSTLNYGKLKGVGTDFLVSTRHGPVLLNSLNKNNDIRVISSTSESFVINYDSAIETAGFTSAEEITLQDTNLELIEDLPEIRNFVIVGDDYGYSAIAVAPYAVVNQAWVFIADRTNIDEIDAILSQRAVDEILIYGFVDREIRQTLEKYNPEQIDTGDRFKDNTEIVDKYLEINPVRQVLLSNGEFIERELMSGSGPVLFTGKENVPDQISNYIKSSDIEVGVLIGSDLVGAATNIRRSTGISVIVKFARGARAPTGTISAVEGLDLFYLPIPIVQLDISSAKYNRATSQLELTYKSDSNVPVFFRGTITPITDAGESTRIGDVEPVFIAPNDLKTVVYPDLEFVDDSLSLEVFTLYGDTPSSLEKILERTLDVEIVNVIDRCNIEIENIKYSTPKEAFFVKVTNNGDTDCYVDIELSDVLVDNVPTTIGSEGSVKIPAGKSENIKLEFEMTEEDLESNSFIDVIAYYGEREDGLVNIVRGRFELKIETISFATISLITISALILIALIILIVLWRRRKEEDDF